MCFATVRELLERFAGVCESFGSSLGDEDSEEGLRAAVGPLAQSLDAK